jgi:hypothetical protein
MQFARFTIVAQRHGWGGQFDHGPTGFISWPKAGVQRGSLEEMRAGRAKPNPYGAALVLLVRRHPSTLGHWTQ